MRKIHKLAAGAAVALAGLGSGTAAYAAGGAGTPPGAAKGQHTWSVVHSRLEAALEARTKTLSRLSASVANNKHLTASDRTALQNRLSPEISGIGQLLQTVESATPHNTTIAQLRADARTMIDQYRVYAVMAPQVRLTEGADTETFAELRLSNAEARIDAAIQKHKNPPTAVGAYNDLVTQVSRATSATGEADIPAVLEVTPSGYPGDAGALKAARNDLAQARTDLKAARGDLRIIRNALTQGDSPNRPAAGSPTPSGSSAG